MANITARIVKFTATSFAGACLLSLPACSHSEPPANTAGARTRVQGEDEQALVERSASAFEELRKNPRYAKMDEYLKDAKGVMIFPRLVKASIIVGGEGGNGVLVAKKADGTWSGPAFYSIGSPSVGLQIGYQQATVVLFLMNDRALARALNTNFALGAKAGTSLGDVAESGKTNGAIVSASIYQVIAAEGAFAGVSLDGYVVGSRSGQNREYYGRTVTPEDILVSGSAESARAAVLDRVLAPRAPRRTDRLEVSAR